MHDLFEKRFLVRLLSVFSLLAVVAVTAPVSIGAQDDVVGPPGVEGLVYSESSQSFESTWDAIVGTIEANPNLGIAGIVDHQANAERVGLELDPNRVVIFGNPNMGTPLMQANQVVGIDLPQRIQVFESDGQVFVGFNDATFLADRHGIGGLPQLDGVAAGLRALAAAGTGPDQPMTALGSESFVEDSRLVTVESDADFETTFDRLIAAIDVSPAGVFTVVEHGANAANAGLELDPTRVVLFGNPVSGTPVIDEVPTAGFDLPLRILVWEDADGSVMVTSNTIELYTERHGVVDADLTMINGALNNFVAAATGVPAPMPAPADDAGDSVVAPGAVVEFVNLEFDRFLEVQPTGNVYTSDQSNTATEFILHPVDGLDDTFLIQSVSTGLYVHGHGEGNDFNVDIDGTPDEFDYWRIDLFDEGYHVFNVGRERLLQADRAGFNVDTNREVIDAMDFGLDVEWNITAVEDE